MPLMTLITGPLEVNTYILSGAKAGECFIVDPSDVSLVANALETSALTPTHILLTHGHFDHILAVAELKAKYGAKVCIHERAADALRSERASLSSLAGMRVKPCESDVLLRDGDELTAAGFSVRVLHTPGHSAGSVCYVVESERLIFAGDTLFRLSVGRSDLPGGNAQELHDSIEYKLFPLHGDYDVYPGHMRKTTLAFEREHNPFMRRWSPETW